MPVIEILGWVWMGIIIGSTAGIVWTSKHYADEISDRDSEISVLKGTRDVLKEEIFRLENQAKPKPRKRRKKRVVKVDKIKVGK